MKNGRPNAQEEKRKAFVAPVAAILSALGSLACCLPLAFLAALGMARPDCESVAPLWRLSCSVAHAENFSGTAACCDMTAGENKQRTAQLRWPRNDQCVRTARAYESATL